MKYIEYNPIKAGITDKIGRYRWAMSSGNFAFPMLNDELIKVTNFDTDLDERELTIIDELYSAKLETIEDVVIKKELQNINCQKIA